MEIFMQRNHQIESFFEVFIFYEIRISFNKEPTQLFQSTTKKLDCKRNVKRRLHPAAAFNPADAFVPVNRRRNTLPLAWRTRFPPGVRFPCKAARRDRLSSTLSASAARPLAGAWLAASSRTRRARKR